MANEGMLTPVQIRAARALLNWSQDELAEASGVARQSIKNIERGVTDPRLSTATAIKTTLEKAGVQFLDPSDLAKGPGVALKVSETEASLTRQISAIEADLADTAGEMPATPAGGMKLRNKRTRLKTGK